MKNLKFLMPMLAFVMAVGLAFTTKADVQTAGWINLNGVATQLENPTCESGGFTCQVTFGDDDTPYTVYTNQSLQIEKTSVSDDPYNLPEMQD